MWSSTPARAVAAFELGDVLAGLVGEGGLEAVAVVVGERQLRAGMWALATDEHPRTGRPGVQVEPGCELADLPASGT
jgi:hypothetical protein